MTINLTKDDYDVYQMEAESISKKLGRAANSRTMVKILTTASAAITVGLTVWMGAVAVACIANGAWLFGLFYIAATIIWGYMATCAIAGALAAFGK